MKSQQPLLDAFTNLGLMVVYVFIAAVAYFTGWWLTADFAERIGIDV